MARNELHDTDDWWRREVGSAHAVSNRGLASPDSMRSFSTRQGTRFGPSGAAAAAPRNGSEEISRLAAALKKVLPKAGVTLSEGQLQALATGAVALAKQVSR